MSDLASAADILGRNKRRFTEVTIGGLTVRLRTITAGEYALVERKLIEAAGSGKGSTEAKRVASLAASHATLLRLCCVDADGQPLFSEKQVSELATLDGGLSSGLVSACMDHCGLSGNDLEELAKNSAEMPPDGSPTG